MQTFKILPTLRLTMFTVVAMLAVGLIWPIVATAQDNSDEAKTPDAQAVHEDQQPSGDETLAAQIAELRDKVGRLEALVAKSLGEGMTSDPSGGMETTGGKSGDEGMGGGKGMGMMGQGGQGMGGGKGMGMMGQGMGGGKSEMGGSVSQQMKKLMLKMKIKKIELEMIELEVQIMEVK